MSRNPSPVKCHHMFVNNSSNGRSDQPQVPDGGSDNVHQFSTCHVVQQETKNCRGFCVWFRVCSALRRHGNECSHNQKKNISLCVITAFVSAAQSKRHRQRLNPRRQMLLTCAQRHHQQTDAGSFVSVHCVENSQSRAVDLLQTHAMGSFGQNDQDC